MSQSCRLALYEKTRSMKEPMSNCPQPALHDSDFKPCDK